MEFFVVWNRDYWGRIESHIWNGVELGVFKGDNRPFKVVATILETLDMEPHGNDKKKVLILERKFV
jgi:hypothetical protein